MRGKHTSKKNVNQFDYWVEAYLKIFEKSPNSHLLFEDPNAMGLVQLSATKTIELHSLEQMFKLKVVPHLQELEKQSKRSIKYSKYAHLLDFEPDTTEDINQWVRLGYVALFHKYESFHRAVFPLVDAVFGPLLENRLGLIDYIKQEYKFDMNQWRINETIWEVNYVAISEKHYEGKPKQYKNGDQDIPPRFRGLHPNDTIRLTPEEFYKDAERVRQFITSFNTDLMMIEMSRIGFSLMMNGAVLKVDVEKTSKFISSLANLNVAVKQSLAKLAQYSPKLP